MSSLSVSVKALLRENSRRDVASKNEMQQPRPDMAPGRWRIRLAPGKVMRACLLKSP
jgi:hypothetical protein